jgi:Asp-tRNA(Asn)/Glu-tRNA(Gln) amidotransferase A subunit family amidase
LGPLVWIYPSKTVSVSIAPLKPSRGRNIDDKPIEPWHISVKGHITRTVRDSAALFDLAYQLRKRVHGISAGHLFLPRKVDN